MKTKPTDYEELLEGYNVLEEKYIDLQEEYAVLEDKYLELEKKFKSKPTYTIDPSASLFSMNTISYTTGESSISHGDLGGLEAATYALSQPQAPCVETSPPIPDRLDRLSAQYGASAIRSALGRGHSVTDAYGSIWGSDVPRDYQWRE